MPRIPRPLARKLDRLAQRAHRFHRFAHHPLCDEYAGELVRLGRRGRVCRGCTLTLAGGVLGALCGAWSPIAADAAHAARSCVVVLAAVVACGVVSWIGLGLRRASRTSARLPKMLTRFAPAALLSFSLAFGVRSGGIAGSVLLASSLLVCSVAYARYRSRGPSRTPCETCPERTLPEPCRGYAPIVRRERAFARVARRMLA